MTEIQRLQEVAHGLAMLALHSELYNTDESIRDAVDSVLEVTQYPWKVTIIESEAGWGQRVDGVNYFRTKELADTFVEKHNKNLGTEKVTPGIYWKAETPKCLF